MIYEYKNIYFFIFNILIFLKLKKKIKKIGKKYNILKNSSFISFHNTVDITLRCFNRTNSNCCTYNALCILVFFNSICMIFL